MNTSYKFQVTSNETKIKLLQTNKLATVLWSTDYSYPAQVTNYSLQHEYILEITGYKLEKI